jgi:hypothetical protein
MVLVSVVPDHRANQSFGPCLDEHLVAAARFKTSAGQFFAVDEQFLSRYFQITGS